MIFTIYNYNIKMTTEASIINIVLLVHLSEEIDISVLSTLINLVYLLNKPNNNDKIIYYGVEGAVISANYNNYSRGIRKVNKIKSFASFDLQCSNKNIHVKLSKNKISLMGVLNLEMGSLAINYILSHIKMTEENWSKIRILPLDIYNETILWIKNNYLNDKNKQLPIEFPNNIDKNFAEILYYNLFDYNMISENYYDKRIEEITKIIKTPIYNNIPTINKIEVANRVLNYKLGSKKISLIDTVMKLKEKGYYKTVFHNTIHRKAKFMLPVKYINENDENKQLIDEFEIYESTIDDKNKYHSFIISQSSSVTQYSPTSELDSIKAYRIFCTDLGYTPVN
jgi:hypothetical protein